MSNQHFDQITAAKWIATWFGVGLLTKKGAGTLGSLAAFLTLPLLCYNTLFYLFFIILITFVGIWASQKYCVYQGTPDASEVVIDEVAGQALVFYLINAGDLNFYKLVGGFCLFRIFDVLKPWPISFIDQNIKTGFGVMLDDLLAAIGAYFVYTLITIFLI